MWRRGIPTFLLLLVGCGDAQDAAGPMVLMDYEGAGFFDSPFPDEHRRAPDGLVDVSAFPNPTRADFVTRLVEVAGRTPAFGATSTIFLSATAPPSASGIRWRCASVRTADPSGRRT